MEVLNQENDTSLGFMDDAMITSSTPIACIYFISFVIFGNFILVNLFLGIIVDTLVSDYEENIIIEEELDGEADINNLTLRNIERLAKLHHKAEKKGIKKTIKSNLKGSKKKPNKEMGMGLGSSKDSNNVIKISPAVSTDSACLGSQGAPAVGTTSKYADDVAVSSTPETESKGWL